MRILMNGKEGTTGLMPPVGGTLDDEQIAERADLRPARMGAERRSGRCRSDGGDDPRRGGRPDPAVDRGRAQRARRDRPRGPRTMADDGPGYQSPLRCFDNAFVRELPGDPELGAALAPGSTALRIRACNPTPVAAPRLIAYSREVAALWASRRTTWRRRLCRRCSAATRCSTGMEPYAANYGGHQFGHWAGQLGDGRAITLGEVLNASR